MISILQERVVGAAIAYRKRIHRCSYIRATERHLQNQPPNSQIKETYRGKKSELEISHYWNKAVDQAFGQAIQVLSSRKW